LSKKVFLIGIKHSGKSTVGSEVAKVLSFDFVDTDNLILENIKERYSSVRKFYQEKGQNEFIDKEYEVINEFLEKNKTGNFIIATGGGICDNTKALSLIKKSGVLLYFYVKRDILFKRIVTNGLPPFLDTSDPQKSFEQLYGQRDRQYRQVCDFMVPLPDCNSVADNSKIVADLLIDLAKRGKIWVQTPLEQLSK